MPKQRAFRSIRLQLKNMQNDELRSKLEQLFIEYECSQKVLVERQRHLMSAQANFQESQAGAQRLLAGLLRTAGEGFDEVAIEPMWSVYRNKEGEIIFESIFTQRDMRNAMRVEKARLARAASEEDTRELFDEDDDELSS